MVVAFRFCRCNDLGAGDDGVIGVQCGNVPATTNTYTTRSRSSSASALPLTLCRSARNRCSSSLPPQLLYTGKQALLCLHDDGRSTSSQHPGCCPSSSLGSGSGSVVTACRCCTAPPAKSRLAAGVPHQRLERRLCHHDHQSARSVLPGVAVAVAVGRWVGGPGMEGGGIGVVKQSGCTLNDSPPPPTTAMTTRRHQDPHAAAPSPDGPHPWPGELPG